MGAANQGQQQQAQPAQANAQPAQPAFALVPGGGDADIPWNFTSGDGLKLFQAATRPIEPKFNGASGKLQHFLDSIHARANTYGLSAVLQVNVGGNDIRSLTKEYGALNEAQVRAHAITYQGLDNRNRQAAAVLKTLIDASIEPETRDELKQTDYSVTVNVNGNDEAREDGPLMLYKLINLVSVEVRATCSGILKKLTGAGLSAIMEEEKSDVKAFNTQVNMLVVALRARRREVPDLIPYLFEAYQTCNDSEFRGYMKMREQFYNDGTTVNLTSNQLMETALQQYKTLVDSGKWQQKSQQELEFIAMMSKLQATEKKLVQVPTKPRQSRSTNKKNDRRSGPTNDGVWAWKGVAPKAGEPTTKEFRGKKYIYCDHGETKWVLEEKRGVKHKDTCTKLYQDSDT
ncbi:MAG: hypothetical protein SGARI_004106, partial [Bacillariaceae sp.]